MSYWIIPEILSDEQRSACVQGEELVLPADGLADIARAQGPDQIEGWLRNLKPEATPEEIASLAQHFWKLGHELQPEDSIILRTHMGQSYMIGEVTGHYQRESRALGMSHIWPVHWHHPRIPANQIPILAEYSGNPILTEISDERTLIALRPYIPMLQKGSTSFFKWLGIIILIFELIYFWPSGSGD